MASSSKSAFGGNNYTPRRASFSSTSSTPTWPKADKTAHVCPTCQRGFSRSEHLERHMSTHLPSASSKVFVCNTCGKGFSRKDVLIRHVRAVHETPKTEVKRSRRRSCRRCAGFKIKCTGGTSKTLGIIGSCEACKKRGAECIFDIEPPLNPPPRLQPPTRKFADRRVSNRRFSDAVLEPPTDMFRDYPEPPMKRRRTIDDPQSVLVGLPRLLEERENMSHHLLSAAQLFSADPNDLGNMQRNTFMQSMDEPHYSPEDDRMPQLSPMVLDPRLAGDCGDGSATLSPTLSSASTARRISDGYEHEQMYIPSSGADVRDYPEAYGASEPMNTVGQEGAFQNGLLSVPEEDFYAASTLQGILPVSVPMKLEDGSVPLNAEGDEHLSSAGSVPGPDWRNVHNRLGGGGMSPDIIQEPQQGQIAAPMADRAALGMNNAADNWGFNPAEFDFDWFRENDGADGTNVRGPHRTGNTPILFPPTPTPTQTPDMKNFTSSSLELPTRRFKQVEDIRFSSPSTENSQEDNSYMFRTGTPGGSGAEMENGEERSNWSTKWQQTQDHKIKLPPIRQVLEEYSSPRGSSSSRRSSYGKISYDPTNNRNNSEQMRREMSALRGV